MVNNALIVTKSNNTHNIIEFKRVVSYKPVVRSFRRDFLYIIFYCKKKFERKHNTEKEEFSIFDSYIIHTIPIYNNQLYVALSVRVN